MVYKICSKTVMDTSDPDIVFDYYGISNHYWNFKNILEPNWLRNEKGRHKINELIANIKKTSSGSKYDCVIGLSGGLDSSYLLHKAVTEWGLNPLVFHVDAGWNTSQAVDNIKKLVNALDLELFTDVIEWEEVKSFQRSLFRAGIPHLDIPQDMAFIASLYKYCQISGIKFILNGGNVSTEGVLMPSKFLYWGTDTYHLRDIFKKHGPVCLPTYPFVNAFYTKIYTRYIKSIKIVKPLNFLDYNKKLAEEELNNLYDWNSYSQKHFESRFTRFYEGYWLPSRFGYDMRRNQLSSLILSGQITRDDALDILTIPPISDHDIKIEFQFIADKLDFSYDELKSLHDLPLKFYYDFKNASKLFDFGEFILSKINGSRRGGAI